MLSRLSHVPPLRQVTLIAITALSLLAAGVISISGISRAQQPPFNPQRVLPRPMPPIKDAPVVSSAEADRLLGESELVVGVVLDGQARAYPINMLTGPQREIINDTLAGRAIAATW